MVHDVFCTAAGKDDLQKQLKDYLPNTREPGASQAVTVNLPKTKANVLSGNRFRTNLSVYFDFSGKIRSRTRATSRSQRAPRN